MKIHRHNWYVRPAPFTPQAECQVEGCLAKLTTEEVNKRLNANNWDKVFYAGIILVLLAVKLLLLPK